MSVVHQRCAGLEVSQQTVVASVRLMEGDALHQEQRTFCTTTSGLLTLVEWLAASGCTHVALEATGIHWQPVCLALEGQFEIVLANAQDIGQVPGREAGVNDAAWIAELLAGGVIRSSPATTALPPALIDCPDGVDPLDPLVSFTSEEDLEHERQEIHEISQEQLSEETDERSSALDTFPESVTGNAREPGETIGRIERQPDDTSHCIRAASRLDEEVCRERATSVRKEELETFEERVRTLTTAVRDTQARMDTLAAKDKELIALTQKVDALSMALVNEGTQKATRLRQTVAELDAHVSRVMVRVPCIERLEERLSHLNALRADVDQRLKEQIARRAELETFNAAHDDVAARSLEGAIVTVKPADLVVKERIPRSAVAVIATAVTSGPILAGLLMTSWPPRSEVSTRPPLETAVLGSRPDPVQVMDGLLRGGTPPKILVPARAPTPQIRNVSMTVAPLLLPTPVYSEEDPTVSRPVPIRRELPPWPDSPSHTYQASALVNEEGFWLPSKSNGVLEVVIGADGQVESASMLVPIRPLDDRRITAATKRWRYQPALKDGQPVRYKESIRVLFR